MTGLSDSYDGLDIVLVYDDSGSLENRYPYGPATDQFFADEDALGEVLWALTDHQRTVRDLVEYDAGTDTTSVVNHIQYPFRAPDQKQVSGVSGGVTGAIGNGRLHFMGEGKWPHDAWDGAARSPAGRG